MPYPAIAPTSKRSVDGSRSKSMRSRADNLPLSCNFSKRFFPPPSAILESSLSKVAIFRRIWSSFILNSNSFFEIAIRSFFAAQIYESVSTDSTFQLE